MLNSTRWPALTGSHAPIVAHVDCDPDKREDLKEWLSVRGRHSKGFEKLPDLLNAFHHGWHFDLLLVQWHDGIGWNDLSLVREIIKAPIILLTPAGFCDSAPNIDQGFFDETFIDFLTYPLEEGELRWRIHLQLRRAHKSGFIQEEKISCGIFLFLVQRRLVFRDGVQIQLKPREFDLALQFFRNFGRVQSRELLWRSFWKSPPKNGARALDTCIAGVRRRLALEDETGFELRSIYRVGYQLRHVSGNQ